MIAFHSSFALITLAVLPLRSFPATGDPVLVKVQPKIGSPVVGQLLKETDAEFLLLDLRTGKQVTLSKRDILRSTTNLSDKEAIAVAGLPSFLAWRIRGSSPLEPSKGKVAKVSSAGLFVTLGAKNGIELGQKLVVLRDEGEIKDPDSGRVLGREQIEVARVEVTDVEQDFSKAKTIGEVKIELRPGDTVEPLGSQKLIATLPLVNADGEETEGGRKLAEELTTGLVSHGIRLVERNLLAKALKELTLQQTELFDPNAARKVGKQVGAYAVLCGTIVSDGKISQAHVRLIEVETGEILFAGSQNLSGRSSALDRPIKASSLPSSARPSSSGSERPAPVSRSSPNGKVAFSTQKPSASVAANAAANTENKDGRIKFVADNQNAWALFQKVGAGKGNSGSYEPAPTDAAGATFVGYVSDEIVPGFGFGRADEDTIRIFRTNVRADKAVKLQVFLGGDDCAVLYVNGTRVAVARLQNLTTAITLQSGTNVIEVANYNGSGGALIHFSQADRTPLTKAPGLTVAAED